MGIIYALKKVSFKTVVFHKRKHTINKHLLFFLKKQLPNPIFFQLIDVSLGKPADESQIHTSVTIRVTAGCIILLYIDNLGQNSVLATEVQQMETRGQ